MPTSQPLPCRARWNQLRGWFVKQPSWFGFRRVLCRYHARDLVSALREPRAHVTSIDMDEDSDLLGGEDAARRPPVLPAFPEFPRAGLRWPKRVCQRRTFIAIVQSVHVARASVPRVCAAALPQAAYSRVSCDEGAWGSNVWGVGWSSNL